MTQLTLADIDRMIFGEDPDESTIVTSGELAEWLGLSRGRVSALAQQGVLPRRADNLYPLKASVRAYADHARKGAMGRHADGEMAAEKIRLAREQADKVALQNARARGEMVAAADVARAWAEVVTDLRAALLAVPSRVAGACSLDRRTAAALDRELRAAMESIADDA